METKNEYEKALKEIDDDFYETVFASSATKRFDDNLNLLRGLVNEHFGVNQETNLERFKDEIFNTKYVFAVINGKVEPCRCCRCDECSFDDPDISCNEMRVKWLLRKHEKPKYKLSQFEYDLLRTNNMSHDEKLKDFATYKNLKEIGYFKDIDFNLTIDEILANCEVVKDEKC